MPTVRCALPELDLVRAHRVRNPFGGNRIGVLAQPPVGLDQLVLELGGERHDARITALWLADWRTHLADRDRYVAALESGSTEPAQFTARGGRSITTTIDHFAEVNSMPSCATPLDV